MNLLPVKSNSIRESELEMQNAVEEYMAKRSFITKQSQHYWLHEYGKAQVFREVRIPEVRRISDVIVKINDRKVINIECKLYNYQEVIHQAKDHLRWADYSVICLHADAFIPPSSIVGLYKMRIGLLLWSKRTGLIEILEAGHNTYKAGKDKAIRTAVMKKLEQKKGTQ